MTWDNLVQKHAQLTSREKLLVLISGLAAIWSISFSLFIEAQYKGWRQQISSGQMTQKSIEQAKIQINEIELQLSKEANGALKQQVGVLSVKQKEVSERLLDQKLALVSKLEMAQTLKSLLREDNQLKLMAFKSLAPEPILLSSSTSDSKDRERDKEQVASLYKHAIVVKITGRYFSILKFLEKIEQSNKKILWQAVDYTVSEYPTADATIEVYTLSTDKEFISVNH